MFQPTNQKGVSPVFALLTIVAALSVTGLTIKYADDGQREVDEEISYQEDLVLKSNVDIIRKGAAKERQGKIIKTEILVSEFKDLRGQAERVQLSDGTICSFVNGATFGVNNERVNYDCGRGAESARVIYGDLIVGEVWKANIAVVKYDAVKEEWLTQSTEVIDVFRVWR